MAVINLGEVFEKNLHNQKDEAKKDGEPHVHFVLLQIVHPQRGPRHYHRNTGDNQHHCIERSDGNTQLLRTDEPCTGACPQKDIGREERPKEHHFGSEEKPDTDLGVVKSCVRARFNGVRNVHG